MSDTHLLDVAQGIYFGIMVLIGVYNLFLFVGTRDKAYLYYVAYLASITLFMSLVSMFAFEFLWPSFPAVNKYAVVSASLTMLTSVLFTQVFLDTKKRHPVLHKISYVFILIAVVDAVLVFTPMKIAALQLAQGGILLMSFFLAVTGVISLRRNYQPARFYLLAWGFLIAALFGMMLESLNVIPVLPYISPGQIGSAIEAMLLSFALADRINLYKREREEAQHRMLEEQRSKAELISHQNEILAMKVEQRTQELQNANSQLLDTLDLVEKEKKISEELLLNILPAEIAEELKQTGHSVARLYQNVTVLFTDFVNFTSISGTLPPDELVVELNRNISAFDDIIEQYGLEKIKTIGDAYLAVCGLPTGDANHALHATQAALAIAAWQADPKNQCRFQMRIGLNSGSVVAGIVGVKKYAYDIWGDTVNVAARMEQNCEPGRVNISASTYELIRNDFDFVNRGLLEVKNLGAVEMYYVAEKSSGGSS
jgi:class 3 adenylate cyclase